MLVRSIFSFSHNVLKPVKEKFYVLSGFQVVACKCLDKAQFL